jgi:amino acid adenylation domain-containing protein
MEDTPIYIHEFFEHNANKHPYKVALSFNDCALSYYDLNVAANQLAHYLINNGVRPGDLIGICQERSFDLIVSILATLKTGAAYVPIDPTVPASRIALIVQTAQPVLTLTHEATYRLFSDKLAILNLDSIKKLVLKQPAANVLINRTKMNLAYIIFTSGTTGVPNGVRVSHSNLSNLICASREIYDFNSNDVWTLFHSFAFDFSVWEIWGALAFGGRLVIVPYFVSRSPVDFFSLIIDEEVTILNQTPSAFYQFIEAETQFNTINKLRKIILGGEPVDTSLLKPWLQKYPGQPFIYNMYGITEVTVHATYHHITLEDAKAARNIIGKPLPNYFIELCDEEGQPVTQGNIGEIYVYGDGVAKGYLRNPTLTEKKFVLPNSHSTQLALYKSGDLAYYAPDGNLEYVGRKDHQVKIRGFRIELLEIEAIINQQPEIHFAIVIVKNKEAEKRKLIGFVQLRQGHTITEKELKERLKKLVPMYMVPARIKIIEKMPLTVNGKIDRDRLVASIYC